jgi:hypothetical protein
MEKEKNNDLVARLMLPTTAITVQGEKLSNLPPTIGDVMRATRSTGLRVERDEVKVVEPTRFVLSGRRRSRSGSPRRASPRRSARPFPRSPAAPDAGGPVAGSPAPGGLPTAATDDGDVDVAASPLLEPLSTPQAPPPPPAAGDTKPAAAPKAAAPARRPRNRPRVTRAKTTTRPPRRRKRLPAARPPTGRPAARAVAADHGGRLPGRHAQGRHRHLARRRPPRPHPRQGERKQRGVLLGARAGGRRRNGGLRRHGR